MFWNDSFLMTAAFPNPCLRPLLPSLPPSRWLTVLAAGSKPAVHLMANVFYHSPPCRWSDLAAALVHWRARLSHLSLTVSRKPASTWPAKCSRLGLIRFMHSDFKPSWLHWCCQCCQSLRVSIYISSHCFGLLIPRADEKCRGSRVAGEEINLAFSWRRDCCILFSGSDHTKAKISLNIELWFIKDANGVPVLLCFWLFLESLFPSSDQKSFNTVYYKRLACYPLKSFVLKTHFTLIPNVFKGLKMGFK